MANMVIREHSQLYLSEHRAMYLGRLQPLLCQASAATTLVLGLEGDLELMDPSGIRRYRGRSFLIPAGSRTVVDTHGQRVALCFLDALGQDLLTLVGYMQHRMPLGGSALAFGGLPTEPVVIHEAQRLWQSRASVQAALQCLAGWVAPDGRQIYPAVDGRVIGVLKLIRQRYTENTSVISMAQDLNISVPRLTQLFRLTTGVPIRRFRLWYRIYQTAVKMSQGFTLTEAAVASGFCDASQFSRVFKQIGGVSPSDVLNHQEILIRVLHDLPTTVPQRREASMHQLA